MQNKEIYYSTNALLHQGKWRNKQVSHPYGRSVQVRRREELMNTFGEFEGYEQGLGFKKPKILKAVQKGASKAGKATVKGTKAVGKGVVKGTKAVGKGVVKGAKATGKAVVKAGKAVGKAAKWMAKKVAELCKKVIKLFNDLVVKNVVKIVTGKKGMSGYNALGGFGRYDEWGLGIDAKSTAKDAAGLTVDELKNRQGEIATKVAGVAAGSLTATAGAVPAAIPLTMTALTPVAAQMAKEIAATVGKQLLEGKKPSGATLDDLNKEGEAAVNAVTGGGNAILDFIGAHKKAVIIGGISLTALIAIAMILKSRNNDAEPEPA